MNDIDIPETFVLKPTQESVAQGNANITLNSFEWDQWTIPTIRCPWNRFGDDYKNMSAMWCPDLTNITEFKI